VGGAVTRIRAAWWASLGAVAGYALAAFSPFLPTLHFFPRLHRWGLAAIPGEPAILWYGLLIYGAVGGLLGMLAGRWARRAPDWRLVWLFATASLLALAWHERGWFMR
jgi:hypothetical protein